MAYRSTAERESRRAWVGLLTLGVLSAGACIPDLGVLTSGESDTTSSSSRGVASATAASTAGAGGHGHGGGGSDAGSTGNAGGGGSGGMGAGSTGSGAMGGAGGSGGVCVLGTGKGDSTVPAFARSWTFDSDLQGWGESPDVVAVFDDQDGSPSPGAAKVTVPFTEAIQTYSFTQNFASTNMTGQIMSARVRLKSCNKLGSVQAFLTVKSTVNYIFARSAFVTLDVASGWVTLTFDPTKPDFVTAGMIQDLTDVREVDVGFYSTGIGPFTTATIEVDTVGILTVGTGAGGSGGAGGGGTGGASSSTGASSTGKGGSGGAASSTSTATGSGGAGGA
jgi:hypothetical protein